MVIAVFFSSCNTNKISIPNTLETDLRNKSNYRYYCQLVNKSIQGDTLALKEIMLISDIYDGAGYEHGCIMIEIMKAIGDNQFNKGLNRLSDSQKENVKQYIDVGIDFLSLTTQERNNMAKKNPMTYKTLQLHN